MKKAAGRVMVTIGITGFLFAGLSACSEYNDERGKGDAPVANRSGDDTPKHVTNNPDGFGNVVTGCVSGAEGWRYFATTNTAEAPSNLKIEKDEGC